QIAELLARRGFPRREQSRSRDEKACHYPKAADARSGRGVKLLRAGVRWIVAPAGMQGFIAYDEIADEGRHGAREQQDEESEQRLLHFYVRRGGAGARRIGRIADA